jgi:hypothetical protein
VDDGDDRSDEVREHHAAMELAAYLKALARVIEERPAVVGRELLRHVGSPEKLAETLRIEERCPLCGREWPDE